MNSNAVIQDYFEWLVGKVASDEVNPNTHYRLFESLFEQEFIFSIAMDANRALDGESLRDDFSIDSGYPQIIVHDNITFKCTVLEVLVALAERVGQISEESENGDSCANKWFALMLENMNLIEDSDIYFDEHDVNSKIECFLCRKYDYEGNGGPFFVRNPRAPMYETELWYQAMWYLTDYFKQKGEL